MTVTGLDGLPARLAIRQAVGPVASATAVLTVVAVGVVMFGLRATRPEGHATSASALPHPAIVVPRQQVAAPRLTHSQPEAPADATYVWGPTEYAEPVPSDYTPNVSENVARRELANLFPEVDQLSTAPSVHLWALTNTFTGLSRVPVWVFLWTSQTVQFPVGGVHAGCSQTMIINAESGAGITDSSICHH